MSILPALFLSAWTFFLIESGAWWGPPSLGRLAHELTTVKVSDVAWLLLGTVLVALFLHPLQLAMTKILEGYWGSSRIAVALLRRRITHHRKRFERLLARRDELEQRRNRVLTKLLVGRYLRALADDPATAQDPIKWDPEQLKRELENLMFSTEAHRASGTHAAMASIPALLAHYPDPDRMMPTRLGNTLRSAEDSIGRQYALDAVRTTPYIALIAPETHLSYLQDARQQLDTSVRLCVVALLVTAETVGFLCTDGWWLLTALGPYFLAYIAYRASIAAAAEYMEMVRTVLDLNRFKLYESLHLEQPGDTEAERANNVKLMDLLAGDDEANLSYVHPVAGTPSTGDSASTPPKTP
ncbi:hypothetical protein [Amycolatopsis plumensis]|uniref:hypothetical protein n=1 Tax=Amycolatopsis plumensis TaxID=236508 RepID=UPI00361475F1